jgi:hypothetical protein
VAAFTPPSRRQSPKRPGTPWVGVGSLITMGGRTCRDERAPIGLDRSTSSPVPNKPLRSAHSACLRLARWCARRRLRLETKDQRLSAILSAEPPLDPS